MKDAEMNSAQTNNPKLQRDLPFHKNKTYVRSKKRRPQRARNVRQNYR